LRSGPPDRSGPRQTRARRACPLGPVPSDPPEQARPRRTHRSRPGPVEPAEPGPAPVDPPPAPPTPISPAPLKRLRASPPPPPPPRPRRSAPLRSSRSEHLPQLLAEPFALHRDARPAQGIRGDQESLLKQRRSGQPGDLGAVVDVPAGTGDPE